MLHAYAYMRARLRVRMRVRFGMRMRMRLPNVFTSWTRRLVAEIATAMGAKATPMACESDSSDTDHGCESHPMACQSDTSDTSVRPWVRIPFHWQVGRIHRTRIGNLIESQIITVPGRKNTPS